MQRAVKLKTSVFGSHKFFPSGTKGLIVGTHGEKVRVSVRDTIHLGNTTYKGTVIILANPGDIEDIPTHEPIPADFPVQPLRPDQEATDRVTCGHCGLSWDDAKPTAWTPAPSARCPFEYFHLYDGNDA